MGHVGPLGKTLIFLSPLGSLKFYNFLSFLFILKLSYAKPVHNTLNYASTTNIEEVIKLYNLGDKTFETDFSLHICERDLKVFRFGQMIQLATEWKGGRTTGKTMTIRCLVLELLHLKVFERY